MAIKIIIPTPTLGGVPNEEDIIGEKFNSLIEIYGPEGLTGEEQLVDGVPGFFHTGTAALLNSFPETIHGILIAGTTGEGPVFGINQFRAIVGSHLKHCPSHLVPYVGILGGDDMVAKQIEEAQALGARNFVLGLNHTGDNRKRFCEAIAALNSDSSIWLYNMPTFRPVDLDFIRECMKDSRVKGIKDSSGKLVDFQALLGLRKERSDFEIYLGSEPLAVELTEDERAIFEGIIAGNANINPQLLAEYTNNPQKYRIARQKLHNQIHSLSRIDDDKDSQGNIRNHLHGFKIQAQSIEGIDHRHVVMYSKRKSLFTPHSG